MSESLIFEWWREEKSCAAEKDDWQAKQNMKSLSKGEGVREGGRQQPAFSWLSFRPFSAEAAKKGFWKGKTKFKKRTSI